MIPAIDIKGGKCVRLRQGRFEDVTVFSDDPVDVARRWLTEGARRLHVVDLDGAAAGEPQNAATIRGIVDVVGHVPVEVGGGICSFAAIEAYLDAGVAQVIIGTQAVEDPEFFAAACRSHPGKVMLGIDARDGLVATRGWQDTSRITAIELARRAVAHRPFAIVYTDIARDGMLSGLNVPATVALAEAAALPVIASGGVGSFADIESLESRARASTGEILGAIVGRAIYERSLDLKAAQTWLDTRAAS